MADLVTAGGLGDRARCTDDDVGLTAAPLTRPLMNICIAALRLERPFPS
ncbi:hypothetical protein [Nocardia sp. NPDC059239]